MWVSRTGLKSSHKYMCDISLFQAKYSVLSLFWCLLVCSFSFWIITYIRADTEKLQLDLNGHFSVWEVYLVLERHESQVRLRLNSASGKSLDRPPLPSDLSIGSYVCSSLVRHVSSLTSLLQFCTVYTVRMLSALVTTGVCDYSGFSFSTQIRHFCTILTPRVLKNKIIKLPPVGFELTITGLEF